MTPRFASIAGSLPKYRDHHRKLLRCRDEAHVHNFANGHDNNCSSKALVAKSPTEIVVGTNVAGKWSVSAVNEFQSITTPAYWGDVTDECRPGGPAEYVLRRAMEVVACGVDRRSRSAWAARERAADDWHRRIQRRDQYPDAVRLTLYASGL